MIEGTGIDLLEIERVEKIILRQPNFSKRILTEKEKFHFQKLSEHRKIEFLAGRFAAKEAFSKALGTGIGKKLSFLDIEILPDKKNKPIVYTAKYSGNIHVSITHTEYYVMAQVILEKND